MGFSMPRSRGGPDGEFSFHAVFAVTFHERKFFVAVKNVTAGRQGGKLQRGGFARRYRRIQIDAGIRLLQREVVRCDFVVVHQRQFHRTAGDDFDSIGLETVIAEMDRDLLGPGVRGGHRKRNRKQQRTGENS